MAPTSTPRTASEFAQLRRHGTYYLNGGDIHFLVENYLFRVHRYFFERESPYFRDKLTVPATPGRPQQGTEDSNAILLDVRAQDFEQLMWVFYNPLYSIYKTGVPQWLSILELAHRWTFREVKSLVVRELEEMFMTPIDRIVYYQKFEVDENLLVSRYAAVCAREEAITIEEGERLGIRTAMRLTQARERLRSGSDGSKSPLPASCKDDDVRSIVMTLFEIPMTGMLPPILPEPSEPPAPVTFVQEPTPAPTAAPTPAPAPEPIPEVIVEAPVAKHDPLQKTSTKSQSNLKKADTKAAQGPAKPAEANPPIDSKPQQNDNEVKPYGPANQLDPIKTSNIPQPKTNGTNGASVTNGSTPEPVVSTPPPTAKSPRESGVGSALKGLFHKSTTSVDMPSTPIDNLKGDAEGAGTDAESDWGAAPSDKKKKKNSRRNAA